MSILLFKSCASYEKFRMITEDYEFPSQVFKASFKDTYNAVTKIMKTFELVKGKDSNRIITDWIDNTIEVNFADSFTGSDSVEAAKYKIIVTMEKGFRYDREVTRVTVYKRQLVQQGLFQGFKEVPSDLIFEKTLLYRIRRVLAIDQRIQKILDLKEQKEVEDFENQEAN